MDSVPRAGVKAVVSCATKAQFFVAYCGPQYRAAVCITVELPVPHRPFACNTRPTGHTLDTMDVLVELEQFDESPGMGKYPVGHDIYLEHRFVFTVSCYSRHLQSSQMGVIF